MCDGNVETGGGLCNPGEVGMKRLRRVIVWAAVMTAMALVARPAAASPFLLSDPGGIAYNGHLYWVIGSDGSLGTWDAAESFAESQLQAHLVHIDDLAENDFVESLAVQFAQVSSFWGPVVYIGLTDVANENTFVWADGSPLGFSNFAPGEPNGTTNENWVLMWAGAIGPAGSWNDEANGRTGMTISAVAEYDPQQPVVPEPATLFLFGTGLTVAAVAVRRRKRVRPAEVKAASGLIWHRTRTDR
jgi:Lectin C-type domain/PEP-CTERM motif